ncbi:MAG: hypothetical protein ACYSU2_06630, partial [Planctomycetota bacterium]
STVLPAVHHLFADEELCCEVCETGADGEPALAVACDGPCGDATHHHHPAHDGQWCPVCQSAATLQWHLAAAMGSVPNTGPAKIRPRVATSAPAVADLRTLSARAPPTATST